MRYSNINESKFYEFDDNDLLVEAEINECFEGETIETRVERMLETNEPITDSAPLIYTEKEEGVKAEHDIRTDVWDVALDAIDAGQKIEAGFKAETRAKAEAKAKSEQSDIGESNPQVDTSDHVTN